MRIFELTTTTTTKCSYEEGGGYVWKLIKKKKLSLGFRDQSGEKDHFTRVLIWWTKPFFFFKEQERVPFTTWGKCVRITLCASAVLFWVSLSWTFSYVIVNIQEAQGKLETMWSHRIVSREPLSHRMEQLLVFLSSPWLFRFLSPHLFKSDEWVWIFQLLLKRPNGRH